MDVDSTLLSITMTYLNHGCMSKTELEGFKVLLKNSTDRRAIQVFNNGHWYDTSIDYFVKEKDGAVMKEITMYTGKSISVKVDLDNLLETKTEILQTIPYHVASKYPEFIFAIELCIEDCLDIVQEITDEDSYKLAIKNLITIINDDEQEMEDSIMKETTKTNETINTTNLNNEEEVTMGEAVSNVMAVAVEEMMGKFTEAKENVKVNVGETAEEFIEKTDDSVDVMKAALTNVLNTLDGVLGYSILKDSILEIMEAGSNGKTSKDLFRMARKCRELLEEEIENLEYWGDADSLGKAIQLKALVGDERGKSIFEAFASGCVWIAKKVSRKLRKWFKIDDEKSVMGAICKSISGFTKAIRAGIKIVWNTTKFAVSFIVAGVVKVGDFIYRTFKSLFTKIKDWGTTQYKKFSNKDVKEDLEENLELENEVIFANEEYFDEN